MQLRDYQAEAIAAAYEYLRTMPGRNPCIVLPTGAGKTPVLSTICHDAVSNWGGRVLVVSHVKELIEQSAKTLKSWYPGLDVGVYSAGIGSRDKRNAVVVAGIQSVFSKGLELSGTKPFNLILIDEAHRIPTDGDGQYQRLLSDLMVANPKTRVIGLTATPYRTKGGWVCSDEYFLNDICYEVSVRQLISQGYLSKLTSKRSHHDAELSGVAIARGEFVADQMEAAFDEIVDSAVEEIIVHAATRKSVLVFCAGVDHATRVTLKLRETVAADGVDCLTGETNKHDRERIINSFKAGATKYLCNVNVLTEGFDATGVDMVVLLRATLSPGLYYQMVGRGLRLHEGKENCLVLDFGGNVLRHGPIDDIRVKSPSGNGGGPPPAKECPECNEVMPIGYASCPNCGWVFPEPKPRHEGNASDEAILSGEITDRVFAVTDVQYAVHYKRGWEDGQPRTMRVDYFDGIQKVGSEWVCVEHEGFAWRNAFAWWSQRSNARIPADADDAVAIANLDLLNKPKAIKVRSVSGEKFDRIIDWDFTGCVAEQVDQEWLDDYLNRVVSDDEVPF